MIDLDFQFALRTRNKKKLSVPSIGKAFNKIDFLRWRNGTRASCQVPVFRGGRDVLSKDTTRTHGQYLYIGSIIVSYKRWFLLHWWEGFGKVCRKFHCEGHFAKSNAHVVSIYLSQLYKFRFFSSDILTSGRLIAN